MWSMVNWTGYGTGTPMPDSNCGFGGRGGNQGCGVFFIGFMWVILIGMVVAKLLLQ
jgi:hypothetical protein